MKGNKKLIGTLNELLASELTAISQYMVHSEMCDNWGYEKLHAAIEKQAKEEMQHAESLIKRILFLDAAPGVTKINPMKIGKTVLEIVSNDEDAELEAIRAYNTGIALAGEVADQSTADLLTGILKMEEAHLDWNEIQHIQIDQMGLQNYLANQA
jgi:bacterioferritin